MSEHGTFAEYMSHIIDRSPHSELYNELSRRRI